MAKSRSPIKRGWSDLELTVINHENHAQHDGVLRDAQKFLAGSYSSDEVISYEWAKKELSDKANEAYTWMVAKHNGEVVGTVVYDIWQVPRSPITEKLISNGKDHYIPIFYATTAKEYEPVLGSWIERIIQSAKDYSLSKGKRNIGILTGDIKHARVFRELSKLHGGGYIGKIGVPTLDDAKVQENYDINFKAKGHEKLIFIPFQGKWTKSTAKRVVASYLDEGYNEKSPKEQGYKPLTNASYFKQFAEMVDKRNPGRYVIPKPITFNK